LRNSRKIPENASEVGYNPFLTDCFRFRDVNLLTDSVSWRKKLLSVLLWQRNQSTNVPSYNAAYSVNGI